MRSDLPPDWQSTLLEMIRGAAPLDGALFAGSESLSGDAQLGVYARQFRLRIQPALNQDAPGLAALVGPEIAPLFTRYLMECPPRSWSLDHLADRLENWLARQGAPLAQQEMARLDHAVQEIFFAAEPVPLDPAALGGMPDLVTSPAVRLMTLQHSVHHFRAQALSGQSADPLVQGPFHVIVYRKARRVRHLEVAPACLALLEHIELGLEQAVGAVLQAGLCTEAELGEQIAFWFQLFAERGLVQLKA
ncbi:MAG: hypothetical protein ACI9VR_002416 [Cognaticolwellia sp.]|jgi:hypothetical protein